MKTIGLKDDTYTRLFLFQNRVQSEEGKRVGFSEIIDKLLEGYCPGEKRTDGMCSRDKKG